MSNIQTDIEEFISTLPHLNPQDFDPEDTCPICLNILAEYCQPGQSGVTRLPGCSHVFCKDDLLVWIQSKHGSCPTCRNPFLDIVTPSESDDESSDGGEWLPNEDDDEEFETDAFTSEMDELDWDSHSEWNEDSTMPYERLSDGVNTDWDDAMEELAQDSSDSEGAGPSFNLSSELIPANESSSSENEAEDPK